MHTSFRDGTKASIEMAAVATAMGLRPLDEGLSFTPGDVEGIATICRPASVGGVLAHEGSVDVMSSVTREGDWILYNTQEGVFVIVKATNKYVSACFQEYPWHPDPTGQYAALYRPYHYVGLELKRLHRQCGPARRRHRCAGGIPRRRRRLRQEGPARRGNPRRRGRLHRLGQADLGGEVGPDGAARRYGPPRQARQRCPEGGIVGWDDVEIDNSLEEALKLRRETEALALNSVPTA